MHTESPFCHGVCKKGIPYVLRWQFSTQFHAFHQLPYSPEKIGFQFTDWHRVAVKDAAETGRVDQFNDHKYKNLRVLVFFFGLFEQGGVNIIKIDICGTGIKEFIFKDPPA